MMKELINKTGIKLVVIALTALISLALGSYPSMFAEYKNSKLSSIEMHLADDVMISMRAGQVYEQIGAPQLNRVDIAQPSTSYLAPYIYYIIHKFTKDDNLTIIIYSILGLLSVLATFFTILTYGKLINSCLIVILLSISSTNLNYSLSGWDHLIQAFLLTLSIVFLIKNNSKNIFLLASSVLIAGSVLMRPDGAIITIGVIIAAYSYIKKPTKFVYIYLMPIFVLVGLMLYINYSRFGYITPTTARLKLGGHLELSRSLEYFVRWGFGHFTALTISIISWIIILKIKHKIPKPVAIILFFILLNIIFLASISDVFSYARLYWTTACILSAIVAIYSPLVLVIDVKASHLIKYSIHDYLIIHKFKSAIYILISTILFSIFSYRILQGIFLTHLQLTENSQYKLVKWIKNNLDPKDGSIGLFYLGYSFHIKNFEIADFLGKGDEMIANSEVKYGPPGHNKWDVDKTLLKWNPQAIIPAQNSDITNEELLTRSQNLFQKKADYGFIYDLMLNPLIKDNYSYCYINTNRYEINEYHGLYIKKELIKNKIMPITCY